MSKQIKITTPKDYLIIEQIKGDMIAKGSHIYCGICGHTVGTLKTRLAFPFTSDKLLKKLDGCDIKPLGGISLMHNRCGGALFLLQKELSFISLERFNELQDLMNKQKEEQRLKLLN